MLLTNLIVSFILAFNSFDYLKAPEELLSAPKIQNLAIIEENVLVNTIISSWLMYQDIFVYTKKYYDPSFNFEANIIASSFWDNNLWELGFFSAVIGNYVIVSYLNGINRSLPFVYLSIINTLEFLAINTWIQGFHLPIKMQVPVLTLLF